MVLPDRSGFANLEGLGVLCFVSPVGAAPILGPVWTWLDHGGPIHLFTNCKMHENLKVLCEWGLLRRLPNWILLSNFVLNDVFSIPSFEYVSGMIIFKGSAIGPGSKGHAPNKNTLRAYGLGATTDALTLKWVSWHALWATGFGVSCLHQREESVITLSGAGCRYSRL